MAEKRDPPAFQEYAAATLAKLPFRVMSLQDRGLLYTMRLECWVNKKLPADPGQLALMMGLPREQIEDSLPAVLPFLEVTGEWIQCPELENYRQELTDRRRRQSEGGKAGASTTNKKRGAGIPPGDSASITRLPRRGTGESLVQTRSEQYRPDQGNQGEGDYQSWLDDYEATREASTRSVEHFR